MALDIDQFKMIIIYFKAWYIAILIKIIKASIVIYLAFNKIKREGDIQYEIKYKKN